ncbi:MAG TPA: MFS transporter [Kineosporiaceae bacterium]|nr:MFS transporter [Kineosporiaceae bacterium]
MSEATTSATTSGLGRALGGLGWWGALRVRGPVRLLALNALVDAGGSGLAAVCLPFFALMVVHIGPGALAATLSVVGVAELVASVPNGGLAGRFGPGRFLIAAKLTQAAAFVALVFAQSLPAVLALAVVWGLARAGGGGLHQSLTVAVLGEQERSAALGAIRALRNIGYLLAGSLGGILLALGSAAALRAGLVANAASFVFGAFCVARVDPGRAPVEDARIDWSVLRDGNYLGLTLCAAVFGSSMMVLDVGLPLWVLRNTNIPRWSVATVVVVNTTLVILLQYRVARRVETVPLARRALYCSAAAFAVTASMFAVTPGLSAYVALAVLVLAAVTLTAGEMLESPSWWTLAYELAAAERKSEYLAAFDMSWAVLNIAGPALMAVVVAGGSTGWLGYAALLVATSVAANVLVSRRSDG